MLTSRQPVKHLHSNGNARNGNMLEGVVTFSGIEQLEYDEIKNC